MHTFVEPSEPITVEVAVPFTIDVAVNATTGYVWHWVDASGGCEHVGEDDFVTVDDGRVGSGGRQRLTGVARTAGRHTVRLELARSWERADVVDSRTVEVQARKTLRSRLGGAH